MHFGFILALYFLMKKLGEKIRSLMHLKKRINGYIVQTKMPEKDLKNSFWSEETRCKFI